MENLSPAEFSRLMVEEKNRYITELLEEDSPFEGYSSDSDDEDYISTRESTEVSDCEESVENRESEAELDEDDDEMTENVATGSESSQSTTFTCRDNTVWSKTPPIQHQTPIQNILRQRCGPRRSTETFLIKETFARVFSIEMVDAIVRHTNKKAIAVCNSYNEKNLTKTQIP